MNIKSKYFFATLIVICFELVIGINSAQARLECYEEMLQKCKIERGGADRVQCYDSEDAMEKAEYNKDVILRNSLAWYDENVEFYRKRDRENNTVYTRFNLCTIKESRRRFLVYSSSNNGLSTSGSATSGSSTSQASKKSNRQATASPPKVQESTNPPNESGSSQPQPDAMSSIFDSLDAGNNKSGSSKSDDLSKMSLDETVKYFNKADMEKDYVKAFPALKQIVANSNNLRFRASAINKLAQYYQLGQGVEKDTIKAQSLYEEASKDGNADADANICNNYMNGTGGLAENHQLALEYCKKAEKTGNVFVISRLGWLYSSGSGTKNERLAAEYICKAAKQGDSLSIRNAEKLKLNCN